MYGQLPFWVIGFQSPVASRASATGLSLPEAIPEHSKGHGGWFTAKALRTRRIREGSSQSRVYPVELGEAFHQVGCTGVKRAVIFLWERDHACDNSLLGCWRFNLRWLREPQPPDYRCLRRSLSILKGAEDDSLRRR